MGAADGAIFTRQRVQVGGCDVSYLKGGHAGDTEPVLCLHGMGGAGRWEAYHMALGTVALTHVPQLPGWPEGQPPRTGFGRLHGLSESPYVVTRSGLQPQRLQRRIVAFRPARVVHREYRRHDWRHHLHRIRSQNVPRQGSPGRPWLLSKCMPALCRCSMTAATGLFDCLPVR